MRHRLFALLLLLDPGPARAYVIQTVTTFRDGVARLRWPAATARQGIPLAVNASSFPFASADVDRVVRASFGAWEAVATSEAKFSYLGTTNDALSPRDGRNTVLYDPTGQLLGVPQSSGVIAVTLMQWNRSGTILDADIVFNGRGFAFSLSATSTPHGTVDLQDVLTHEIGHLLGLDHTPLNGAASVRPTMFPFNDVSAPRLERTLEADDRAGVSALYPSASHAQTASISGRVVGPDSSGVWGAHVVAYRAGTTTFVVSALTGFAGNDVGPGGDGSFEITGLPAGDYQLVLQPVDGAISHQNFSGIASAAFDRIFSVEWYSNVRAQREAAVIRLAAGGRLAGVRIVTGIEASAARVADFDASGAVDFGDFVLFAGAFGAHTTGLDSNASYDLDRDGFVGFSDFVRFAAFYGQRA